MVKRIIVNVRLADADYARLRQICRDYDKSQTEVLVNAFRLFYKQLYGGLEIGKEADGVQA